jgi:hypothetical protein
MEIIYSASARSFLQAFMQGNEGKSFQLDAAYKIL